MTISSGGQSQNLVRCSTQENGCAVLGAGVGVHIAGSSTAVIVWSESSTWPAIGQKKPT